MSQNTSQNWTCGICGHSTLDVYQYCTSCGSAKRPDQGWVCQSCGKNVPYDAYSYCIHCGTRRIAKEEVKPLSAERKEVEEPETEPEPYVGKIGGSKGIESTPMYCPSGYFLFEKIGSGGFSDVYKARDPSGRLVALKFPRVEVGDTMSESSFKRFAKECKIWSKLKHPNIVEVYECGLKPLPWISMELMEGGSLSNRLKKGPLGVKESLQIAVKIADAIQFAHHNGVIHQDIKPKNILFTGTGIPKLTDWGLVKVLLETSSSAEAFQGTVICAAPEQLDPERFGGVDWRTDIYGFGVVLYWMIAGKPPLCASDLLGYIRKITQEKVRPLHEIDASIPKKLDAVFAKTLAKSKEERYDAMVLVKKDLEEVSTGLK